MTKTIFTHVQIFMAILFLLSEVAERAWREFLGLNPRMGVRSVGKEMVHISGSAVLNPIDEVHASSNNYSQWGLNAIGNLQYIGKYLPDEIKE